MQALAARAVAQRAARRSAPALCCDAPRAARRAAARPPSGLPYASPVAERCRAARGVGGTGGGGRAGRGQRPRGLAVLPFLGMAPAGPASARPGGAARRPYGARPLAGPRSSPSDFVGWCVDRVSRAASLKVAPPAAVRQLEGGASLRQSHAWQLGTGHFHAPHHARALPSKSGRDARRAHAHFVSTPRRAWSTRERNTSRVPWQTWTGHAHMLPTVCSRGPRLSNVCLLRWLLRRRACSVLPCTPSRWAWRGEGGYR